MLYYVFYFCAIFVFSIENIIVHVFCSNAYFYKVYREDGTFLVNRELKVEYGFINLGVLT